MKLYTKGGDAGQTSLGTGRRVGKDDARVSAYGDVDELNAAVGAVVAGCDDPTWDGQMRQVQDRLFVLGAELAAPDGKPRTPTLTEQDVARLESWIDAATAEVAPLKAFVLPSGCELAARLHLARTICRRAERAVVRLANTEPVGQSAIPFLNRLSDLLFAWARLANHRSGVEDIVWHSPGG